MDLTFSFAFPCIQFCRVLEDQRSELVTWGLVLAISYVSLDSLLNFSGLLSLPIKLEIAIMCPVRTLLAVASCNTSPVSYVVLSFGSCVHSPSLHTLILPLALEMETVHGEGEMRKAGCYTVASWPHWLERSLLPPSGTPPGVEIHFSPEMCSVWP